VTSPFRRAIVIVMDSVGIGELPDAASYGDQGSNTLGNLARATALRVPTLRALGLGRVASLDGTAHPAPRTQHPARSTQHSAPSTQHPGSTQHPAPSTQHPISPSAVGRMAEASKGKDSVTGHWEMMGIVLDRAFPVFPHGFDADLLADFSRRTGRGVIGNKAASGTQIIDELGAEHMRTGALIVYTSADSVFQIAAHEDVVPIAELYRACEMAYALVGEGLGIGRVIARPFVGAPGRFTRTANRRDYALPPKGETLMDRLKAAAIPVVAIGKIEDLFAGRGVTAAYHTASDDAGMDAVERQMNDIDRGFIFANLVDFDTQYGHRNDVTGYAENLERFDRRLAGILPRLREDDLLVVTADHGNDPTTPGTDHTREYVPLIATGPRVRDRADLGTRATFADLGQTLAEIFGVARLPHGESFLKELWT
jgi:phosphopentomutase